MKSLSNLLAMSAIFIFIFSICVFSEEPTKQEKKKLSEEELWDIYYKFISEINPYKIPIDRGEHEEEIKPIMEIHEKQNNYELFGNVCICDKAGVIISVRLDSDTGEIKSYYLPEIRITAGTKMEESDVLKIARQYLKYNTQIKTNSFDESIKNFLGQWQIFFRRKQGQYVFNDDWIMLSYEEVRGVVEYRNHLFCEECEDIRPKITEEKATSLAKKYAKEIINKEERFSYQKNRIILKVKSKSIKIINPAYIEVKNRAKKHSFQECQKTRLGYLFVFACDDDPEGNGIELYVDAITGQLLYGHGVSWAKD